MGKRLSAGYQLKPRPEPLQLSPAMLDLIERRTLPFLDYMGMRTPITILLQQAYLQGLNDAIDAMDHAKSKGQSEPVKSLTQPDGL